jgi:nucleotide-binding universal stress UspA family protein
VAPFDRILVPVGPPPSSERALAVAVELVRRTGVPLHVLSVARRIDEGPLAARVAALARAGAPRVRVETQVVAYGQIGAAIAAVVEQGTLVCMSSHGAYGPVRTLASPSVTEAVLRAVQEPVLVVGPRVVPDLAVGEGRIVACLDGTLDSERVLAPAQQWAGAFGLPLWVVHVGPPGSLGGRDGCTVLHERRPARALADLAETAPVAMFVMATHGRTGWARVRSGSVTASTVRRARVPVLVVPARR